MGVTLFFFSPLGIGLNVDLSYVVRPAGPYDNVRLAGKGGPAPAFANMVNVLYVGELGLGCYQAITFVRRSVGGWFSNIFFVKQGCCLFSCLTTTGSSV